MKKRFSSHLNRDSRAYFRLAEDAAVIRVLSSTCRRGSHSLKRGFVAQRVPPT